MSKLLPLPTVAAPSSDPNPNPQAPLVDRPVARLRVLSLNVRGWTSAHGHSNVWDVADMLRKVDADVVALTEAPLHPLNTRDGQKRESVSVSE